MTATTTPIRPVALDERYRAKPALAKALRKAGLTRPEVARQFGCTRHAVRYWELGERTVSAAVAAELAKLAGKPRGALFDRA